jgi:hypothetical protein
MGVKKITLFWFYCPASACWLLGRLQKMLGNVNVGSEVVVKSAFKAFMGLDPL